MNPGPREFYAGQHGELNRQHVEGYDLQGTIDVEGVTWSFDA
jgi:hypothetical protein